MTSLDIYTTCSSQAFGCYGDMEFIILYINLHGGTVFLKDLLGQCKSYLYETKKKSLLLVLIHLFLSEKISEMTFQGTH